PSTLTFGSEAASSTFSVQANIPWGASNDVTWITLSPSGGPHDTTVTVAVTRNLGTGTRTGLITVTGSGLSRNVTVTQSGAAAVLSISPAVLTFGAASASASFAVTANVSWMVADTLTWASLRPASGTRDTSIAVTVEANPLALSRSGFLTVTGGGLSRTVQIAQSGAAAVLTVLPSALEMSADSNRTFLTLHANTFWRASKEAVWISVSPDSGLLDARLVVTVPANPAPALRNGLLTITGGPLTRSINVSQSGSPHFGTIRISTNLDLATFALAGPAAYAGTGKEMAIVNAPRGDYTIKYGAVPGYATPAEEQRTLTDQDTISFTGQYVLVSTDAWEAVNNLAIGSISPITVGLENTIFVGSERSGILRSTDNGNSWTPVNIGLTDLNISSLAINSSGHIFAGSVMDGTFRSTNNGDSWTVVHNEVTALNNSALAINSQDQIFSSTWNGALFRSTNNGNSWTAVNKGLNSSNFSALAISFKGHIFAGTWSNGLFRSTDNGATWVPINKGFKVASRVQKIAIDSTGTLYAGTIEDGVYRSSDDGASWSLISSGITTQSIRALVVDSTGQVFAGTDSGIFRSSDRGMNWKAFSSGLRNREITSLAIDRNGYILAGTRTSEFCRTIQSVTPVVARNRQIPHDLALLPNYPNPFNTVTRIVFSVDRPAHTRLVLYNIRGQKVRTLFDGFAAAGMQQISWNSLNDAGLPCPSGVYFCFLISGNRTDARKILLLR
ncbi:MAG TPA: BACON domain-containing carbohydrate-binding protein, partial [bacterium]|nr:BACON domain-containing carbohydrate-binding protein [bacterium]